MRATFQASVLILSILGQKSAAQPSAGHSVELNDVAVHTSPTFALSNASTTRNISHVSNNTLLDTGSYREANLPHYTPQALLLTNGSMVRNVSVDASYTSTSVVNHTLHMPPISPPLNGTTSGIWHNGSHRTPNNSTWVKIDQLPRPSPKYPLLNESSSRTGCNTPSDSIPAISQTAASNATTTATWELTTFVTETTTSIQPEITTSMRTEMTSTTAALPTQTTDPAMKYDKKKGPVTDIVVGYCYHNKDAQKKCKDRPKTKGQTREYILDHYKSCPDYYDTTVMCEYERYDISEAGNSHLITGSMIVLAEIDHTNGTAFLSLLRDTMQEAYYSWQKYGNNYEEMIPICWDEGYHRITSGDPGRIRNHAPAKCGKGWHAKETVAFQEAIGLGPNSTVYTSPRVPVNLLKDGSEGDLYTDIIPKNIIQNKNNTPTAVFEQFCMHNIRPALKVDQYGGLPPWTKNQGGPKDKDWNRVHKERDEDCDRVIEAMKDKTEEQANLEFCLVKDHTIFQRHLETIRVYAYKWYHWFFGWHPHDKWETLPGLEKQCKDYMKKYNKAHPKKKEGKQ